MDDANLVTPPLNDAEIAWLRDWIQPQHLSEASRSRLRATFNRTSLRLAVIRDFFVEDKARELAGFLATEAEFELHHAAMIDAPEDALPDAHGGHGTRRVSAEEWAAMPAERRFLRFGIGPGRSGDTPGWQRFNEARSALCDERLRRYVECITGLSLGPLMGLSAHAMSAGDLLAPHSDVNPWRRIAFNAYLSPEWSGEHGGDLLISGLDGTVTRVAPTFNSVVMFDVRAHQSHRVTPITGCAKGIRRFSLAAWFLRPQPDRRLGAEVGSASQDQPGR